MNPLNAIVEEQTKRFGRQSVIVDMNLIQEHEKIGSDDDAPISETTKRLLRLDGVNYILGHPEMIVTDTFKKFLMKPTISTKVCAVNELHFRDHIKVTLIYI